MGVGASQSDDDVNNSNNRASGADSAMSRSGDMIVGFPARATRDNNGGVGDDQEEEHGFSSNVSGDTAPRFVSRRRERSGSSDSFATVASHLSGRSAVSQRVERSPVRLSSMTHYHDAFDTSDEEGIGGNGENDENDEKQGSGDSYVEMLTGLSPQSASGTSPTRRRPGPDWSTRQELLRHHQLSEAALQHSLSFDFNRDNPCGSDEEQGDEDEEGIDTVGWENPRRWDTTGTNNVTPRAGNQEEEGRAVGQTDATPAARQGRLQMRSRSLSSGNLEIRRWNSSSVLMRRQPESVLDSVRGVSQSILGVFHGRRRSGGDAAGGDAAGSNDPTNAREGTETNDENVVADFEGWRVRRNSLNSISQLQDFVTSQWTHPEAPPRSPPEEGSNRRRRYSDFDGRALSASLFFERANESYDSTDLWTRSFDSLPLDGSPLQTSIGTFDAQRTRRALERADSSGFRSSRMSLMSWMRSSRSLFAVDQTLSPESREVSPEGTNFQTPLASVVPTSSSLPPPPPLPDHEYADYFPRSSSPSQTQVEGVAATYPPPRVGTEVASSLQHSANVNSGFDQGRQLPQPSVRNTSLRDLFAGAFGGGGNASTTSLNPDNHGSRGTWLAGRGQSRSRREVLVEDPEERREDDLEFAPTACEGHEWMGRNLSSLVFGYRCRPVPLLSSGSNMTSVDDEEDDEQVDLRLSYTRDSLLGSWAPRNSLLLASTARNMGNTRRRRRQTSQRHIDPDNEFGLDDADATQGPNVALSLLAREATGKPAARFGVASASTRLRAMGGMKLYSALDDPAGGMVGEVSKLEKALDEKSWTNVSTIVTRLAPRLIGDHTMIPALANTPGGASAANGNGNTGGANGGEGSNRNGGGNHGDGQGLSATRGSRTDIERDAFIMAGGVEQFLRVFREPEFVGPDLALSNDGRDLSEDLVTRKLAICWNEALGSLRELVYAMPDLVDPGSPLAEDVDFLPFLFTLLSHDVCFDQAAALIEEIIISQSQAAPDKSCVDGNGEEYVVSTPPRSMFCLSDVPNLYGLWQGFNCRQLAHFCRILALLVFEPEDRQLMESPAVLKSTDLLQLRRDRAARAGRDRPIDQNQAILLGDDLIIERLLTLLRIMNFAPDLQRNQAYHVMAHFPFIADTLLLLGLTEMDDWDDVTRLESLALQLLQENDASRRNSQASTSRGYQVDDDDGEEDSTHPYHPSHLGSVATMLENLAQPLTENRRDNANHLANIIQIISSAQQAGVIVGLNAQTVRSDGRSTGSQVRGGSNREDNGASDRSPGVQIESVTVDNAEFENFPGAGPMGMADEAFLRGMLSAAPAFDLQAAAPTTDDDGGRDDLPTDPDPQWPPHLNQPRVPGGQRITESTDAANELQFNAMMLSPYQVEILFVLCTLLGGRRKIDTQRILSRLGMIPILDEMFDRLSWGSSSPNRQARRQSVQSTSTVGLSAPVETWDEEPEVGIHGPGCECNPESALKVQYLRLLHNFCDRDCDNYAGRGLLLSTDETSLLFAGPESKGLGNNLPKKGLLSKLVSAFMVETDDSPYRFWLASCAEAFLRGAGTEERVFVAQSGLVQHLLEDVTSNRLHCAGSLQTAFDLMGELCKGNIEVLRLILDQVDEDKFQRLMSVASSNLVDSNVFMRALLLSVERDQSDEAVELGWMGESANDMMSSVNHVVETTGCYLSHTWWETPLLRPSDVVVSDSGAFETRGPEGKQLRKMKGPADWFKPHCAAFAEEGDSNGRDIHKNNALARRYRQPGWIFPPHDESMRLVPEHAAALPAESLQRLASFLLVNRSRLLRDLLNVVDIRNINHENICCLNTAISVAIFAYRRGSLDELLDEVRDLPHVPGALDGSRRRVSEASLSPRRFASRPSLERDASSMSLERASSCVGVPDVLRNFRELLWFWSEYYGHRGRDRVSLEFSSHLRFHEWKRVVDILCADDGSRTALSEVPIKFPKSPYWRAPRTIEAKNRGY